MYESCCLIHSDWFQASTDAKIFAQQDAASTESKRVLKRSWESTKTGVRICKSDSRQYYSCTYSTVCKLIENIWKLFIYLHLSSVDFFEAHMLPEGWPHVSTASAMAWSPDRNLLTDQKSRAKMKKKKIIISTNITGFCKGHWILSAW